jgi:transposase InsO family protein
VNDIVERLRHHAKYGDGWTRPDAGAAADEIDRLRDELINTRLERDNARRLVEAARREGIAAAATELRAIAARMRKMDLVDLQVLANAATLEQAADALAELPAARKLTGLEYRGG